jgi:hypothetical protein
MGILAALLPILLQYGPALIKEATALFEGNPMLPNESDADYIARMGPQIDSLLADASNKDAQVEQN